MKTKAAISIDVDSLSSIYKGLGLKRRGGYTFIELRSGLENLARFFEHYNIKTTLFFVGNDFKYEPNHAALRGILMAGHEAANHSMTHPQGFRWLTPEEKANEIRDMGEICQSVTGAAPVGFRSPGWNIDDSTLPVLRQLGYKYDSSVFPTLLMPVMKAAHWASMSGQPRVNRTTMGMWRYMSAPKAPYHTQAHTLARTGGEDFVEFPVSVSPVLRIPFFATLLLFTGINFYHQLYNSMLHYNLPIHFQMHLSDFVDYSIPELEDQMPSTHQGAYVPRALTMPLKKKLEIFGQMIDLISVNHEFLTLGEWCRRLEHK